MPSKEPTFPVQPGESLLERAIWSESDFDDMDWHDATCHALAFIPGEEPWTGQLLLDIDYIVHWMQPEPGDTRFSYFLAPATLVFHEATDFEGNLQLSHPPLRLNRLDRTFHEDDRMKAAGYAIWTLDGHDFKLRFQARGFTQYFRRPPVRTHAQWFDMDERDGICLAEVAF